MMALGIISLLAFLALLVILIVAIVKKKPKKNIGIGLAVCFVLFVVGEVNSGSNASGLKAPEASPVAALPSATNMSSDSGTLTVNYLNVGQGDSEFIELPDGKTMLIDAGNPGSGEKIAQYIKDKGHSQIDYLVATHPHADHIGGMADVINSIDVKAIYMPKVSDNTETYKDLLSTISKKGLTVNTAKAGVSLEDTTDLKVNMLAPNNSSYEDLNNYSAVIKIVYKKCSFLFMGDAQELSEKEILKTNADIKADVLKVGHHGSDTSSDKYFLKAVSPKYAVISVGAGNDYGHPKQTTLNNLNEIGVTVYRTDADGTIIATSDGTNISFQKTDFQAIPQKSSVSSTSSAALDTPAQTSTPQASAPQTSTAPAAVAPADTQSTDNQSETVYVTKTGKKYHRAGCSALKGGGTPMSIEQAKARGLTPCKICNP